MKILLVEDHVMLRDCLALYLGKQPDMQIVGEVGTLQEAIERSHTLKPDLVLMDISLPDGSGIDATQTILADTPQTKIIILTVQNTDSRLFTALRSGARGYLLKNMPLSSLVSSLRLVVENDEVVLSPEMNQILIKEFTKPAKVQSPEQVLLGKLTLREMEILKEMGTFASNKEIADRLSLTVTTVKNHIHNILHKLGLRNRRAAGYFAINHRLIKS